MTTEEVFDMPFNFIRKAKVRPAVRSESSCERSDKEEDADADEEVQMNLIRLETLMNMYGGQRHPKIESFETLKDRNDLIEWRFVPPTATVIFVSHEWVGRESPDPEGDQMYHLLLLLERLQKGEINRTEMDAFHSMLYKHYLTTCSEEWKEILSSEKTFIWYDGFCVPKSKREDRFRTIPAFIQRHDFMIILAPGCVHTDRIDPLTQRKMNMCCYGKRFLESSAVGQK